MSKKHHDLKQKVERLKLLDIDGNEEEFEEFIGAHLDMENDE